MSKQLLTEPESLLLEYWEQAHTLERSMERVRDKYAGLYSQVIEAMKQAHLELDASAAFVTQLWGPGYLGFGRKCWPQGKDGWPTGLWMCNLRLEITISSTPTITPRTCRPILNILARSIPKAVSSARIRKRTGAFIPSG